MSRDGKPASIETDSIAKPAIPDYEMLRIIGRGAYGDVWLARGLTGIFRAIKVVWRSRFLETAPYDREFRGLSEFAPISLGSPGQLALLHIGRNETEGFFYYVMELADDAESGGDVQPGTYVPHTLREIRRRRGRLPAAECLDLAMQLTDGLAYLHERSLIHRDIKPSNVVLVGGRPKLADIGLISAQEEASTFVGTEGYIAPEGPVNAASDVYSLGKLLYELATGRDRCDFPNLPEGFEDFPDRREFLRLNRVILRACERDPARRYPTARQLLEDLQRLQRGQEASSPRRDRRRYLALGAGLAVAAAVSLIIWRWPHASAPSLAAVSDPRQAIAVLPFENKSPEAANGFFADGVHEDLIVNLTKIHELRVVARASVDTYREKQDDLAAIGRDLGVAHVLVGAVRRSGQRVRVTAQLIRVHDRHALWAEGYDRELTDVFAIQSELAELIAAALQAKLSPSEHRLIARRATESQAAYDSYVEARTRDENLGNAGTMDQYERVIEKYQEAIAADPKFALPYAQLCILHSKLYWFDRLDPSPRRLALAEAAAEVAVRLAPHDPETKLALGKIAYDGYRNFERALTEFRTAEAGMPNNDQVLSSIGYTLRRMGKWQEALEYLRRAWALNPRAATVGITLVNTPLVMRRYSQSAGAAVDVLTRFPDHPNRRAIAGYQVIARYEIDQNREAYLTALDVLPADSKKTNPAIEHYLSAYRRGNWAKADEILADPEITEVADGTGPSIIFSEDADLTRARIAFLRGQPERARGFAEKALARERAKVRGDRYKAWIALRMAEAEAYCGRAPAAVRGIEVGLAGISNSRDALDALVAHPLAGRIHLILNQRVEALAELTKMMTGPCEFGPQEIRHDPFWSRLVGDAEFERILRSAREI